MRQLIRALRELRRENAQRDLQRFTGTLLAFVGDAEGRTSYVDFLERVAEDGLDPSADRAQEPKRIVDPNDGIRGLRATLAAWGQR